MVWITQKQLSAESREVPDGYELAAVEAGPEWRAETGYLCRSMISRHAYCREPSVAAIARSYGGRPRQRTWGYCAQHAFGKWVEDGKVMMWILREKS
jgi:hypothetical protein